MFTLSDPSFTLIPEGRITFKITDAKYDADFGKMTIDMVTKDGLKNTERYQLIDNKGEVNDGARKALSYFCRMVMDDPSLRGDFDEHELIGKFVTATVEHQKVPSKKDPSKTNTYYKLSDPTPVAGFDAYTETADTKTEEFDF